MSVITITISIDVPDGARVNVSNGGGSSKPFVERAAPPQPAGGCPVHDLAWTLVKAGVSKTKVDENGNPKRYNAFWTCPERGCDEKPDYSTERAENSAIEELPF